jgi:hypothetical protein
MSLIKVTLLLLIGLFLLGVSEPPKGEKTLVPKDVIIPSILDYLMKQGITIDIPRYMEKDFVIVFDDISDLKPEDKRLIKNLKLKRVELKNIKIKVNMTDLLPVSSEGDRAKQQFILNDRNDLRCKIKSFRMKADLKITRKGKDIFRNKLPPIKATIDKFELKDIDSIFSFYLNKSGNDYYAKELELKRMVLSPKASLEIREFPPVINKIISDAMGPAIADIGNKEVLNDTFYKEFNANLPPRIPESGSPNFPDVLRDILLGKERGRILIINYSHSAGARIQKT